MQSLYNIVKMVTYEHNYSIIEYVYFQHLLLLNNSLMVTAFYYFIIFYVNIIFFFSRIGYILNITGIEKYALFDNYKPLKFISIRVSTENKNLYVC